MLELTDHHPPKTHILFTPIAYVAKQQNMAQKDLEEQVQILTLKLGTSKTEREIKTSAQKKENEICSSFVKIC